MLGLIPFAIMLGPPIPPALFIIPGGAMFMLTPIPFIMPGFIGPVMLGMRMPGAIAPP